MSKIKVYIGQKFGTLEIISRLPNEKNRSMWECKCVCGKLLKVSAFNLSRGKTYNCGCQGRLKHLPKDQRKNTFKIFMNVALMFDGRGNYTLVDKEDIPILKTSYWYLPSQPRTGTVYWRKEGTQSVLLHRVLMNAPKGIVVDHIFHKINDNRKSQLRRCTYSENSLNHKPSKRKDPSLPSNIHRTKYNTYRVVMRIKGNPLNLNKTFKTLEEAVEQREKWLDMYVKDFRYKEKD